MSEIAFYSNTRIHASFLQDDNFVGVDNLLPDKKGKRNSEYVPEVGLLTRYQINDVLLGNIRPYLKKIWLSESEGGASGDVLVLRISDQEVKPKYLFYVLSSDKFFSYNNQHAKGAKMPRGNKETIMNYRFSLPSVEEQNRIVDTLDRFESIVHDLQDGLPAEIALRQKQYEYYRDKLLSFAPAQPQNAVPSNKANGA